MRVGGGNLENVAGSERVALRGVLRIDLIGRGGDLDLLMNFLFVIQGESELVGTRVEGESAAGDYEKPFLADFEFVIAGSEIAQSEAAGAVGFSAIDVASGVLEFYLGGGDGNVVFVGDESGTDGGVRGARGRGREDD